MKKLVIVFLVVAGNYCPAQTTGAGVGNQTQSRMQTYSWVSRPDEDGTDLQKKFIKQDWTPGEVKFRSGRLPMQVPLIFDLYNNALYYKMGDLIMEFVDSVSEFSMEVPFRGDTVTMKYKRFYPAIQANSSATFYQLLVEGKLSLLKCKAKSIFLFKDPGSAEERKKDPPKHLYFAYLPGNKIVQIYLNA